MLHTFTSLRYETVCYTTVASLRLETVLMQSIHLLEVPSYLGMSWCDATFRWTNNNNNNETGFLKRHFPEKKQRSPSALH